MNIFCFTGQFKAQNHILLVLEECSVMFHHKGYGVNVCYLKKFKIIPILFVYFNH